MKKKGWGGLSPTAVAANLDDVSDSQEVLGGKTPTPCAYGRVSEGVQGCPGLRVWP